MTNKEAKPTKGQLRKAKEHSLRVYRLALEAAEKGNWKRAADLTFANEDGFCQATKPQDFPGNRRDCSRCAVPRICRRMPHGNANYVLYYGRTPANGLRHFRTTILQLEALKF